MLAWLKRFSLHLAAAIGATGIFVAAAAVGANQTRQQTTSLEALSGSSSPTPTAGVRRRPTVVVVDTATPAPAAAQTQPDQTEAPAPPLPTSGAATKPNQARRTATAAASSADPTPGPERVVPERSLAGTVKDVLPDGLDVVGVGGREWRVSPAAGALIRLNGKAARLDALRPGDTVVILGQAQPREGPLLRFLSHAITARRK